MGRKFAGEGHGHGKKVLLRVCQHLHGRLGGVVFLKRRSRPSHYWRYLDDIWGVWEGTEEGFKDFVGTLNQHHPSIRVKVEKNEDEINFLDTTIFKGPGFQDSGRLDTRVYFKSTDTHALLHRDSHHHAHVFRGIVKAQLLRFRRICTKEGDRVEAIRTLFGALKRRGYSRGFLRAVAKEEAGVGGGGRTLQQARKRILTLVVQFSGTARGLAWAIWKNFNRLAQDEALGAQYRMMVAYRRGKNLGNMLVHSKLGPASRGCKGRVRVTLVREGRSGVYKVKQDIPLNRKNCVYLIRCSLCGKRYVGETKNTILTRMWGHRHAVRRGTAHIVPHFRRHSIQSLKICGLEHNPEWSKRDRLRRERHWIERLGTWFPKGLNVRMG